MATYTFADIERALPTFERSTAERKRRLEQAAANCAETVRLIEQTEARLRAMEDGRGNVA